MIDRIEPGPGQESVWDYPRPPRLEPCFRVIRVTFNGETIATTRSSYRVLETSHPPVYYLPRPAVADGVLVRTPRSTFCEFKGNAHYFDVRVGNRTAENAAWGYDQPTHEFAPLRGHVAFYAHLMDACTVDGEIVDPQVGGFYGGWATADIVGPFKGEPGTRFW